MNNQFDELTKSLAQSVTRRAALNKFGVGLAGQSLVTVWFAVLSQAGPQVPPAQTNPAIPWSAIGAKATADCRGDGLGVGATETGACLHCAFQRLAGEATTEGLWLSSTVTQQTQHRFRVVAAAIGSNRLPQTGTVTGTEKLARFSRPGLVEEYSVSVDGVRQDFVVESRPAGNGPLRVELNVTGAQIEPLENGARLVMENSGRKIAYSRLRVTDAMGKELPARMEVLPEGDEVTSLKPISECRNRKSEMVQSLPPSATNSYETPGPTLVVLVNDAEAVYPVRIDPTFSDANWISMGGIAGVSGIPGQPDDLVFAAVADSSGNLYIGGEFTIAGDVIANHIAKWDGNRWSALGSGVGGYAVYALAVSGTNVYAGGSFTTAGGIAATNIARWDGSRWWALGSGMNLEVKALAVSGSNLYAGGSFTVAGGIAATNIAKWDGSGWSALASGTDGSVNALAVSGSVLYAGGCFTTAGGVSANSIAKWNGSSWSPLGSGTDGCVNALAVSGGSVLVGGGFGTAGGISANSIAKWNGSSWSALGSGINGQVYALAFVGSTLYAGGGFRTAGGSPGNFIAKWNGSAWSAAGSELNYYVFALATVGSNLYAGGWFTGPGDSSHRYLITFKRMAKWNGSSWSAVGSGFNGGVSALAVSGSDLYVGGLFTTAGNIAANYIVRWDGNNWRPLGLGMGDAFVDDPIVNALVVSGSNLYAGGNFTMATNSDGAAITVNGIAKWDGTNWSALGSGINGQVYSLAMLGCDLYVGGFFPTAGGIEANGIAKWDGSSWSALGLGFYGGVHELAVSGSDLYAAGGVWVTNSGGVAITVNGIAKWDGTSWSALGSGMLGGGVYALAVSGSDLYTGGSFTSAGGVSTTNGVAKWNGTSWSALDSGSGLVNRNYPYAPEVDALGVVGSNLYAGGYFTTTDGSGCNNIAKWDGHAWTGLGSGTSGSVTALAVSGGDLYVGGGFITAGGKVSGFMARAYLPALPTLSIRRLGPEIRVSWPSADTTGFALVQVDSLETPASWITNPANVTDDGTNKSVTIPPTNSAQFFRLRRP